MRTTLPNATVARLHPDTRGVVEVGQVVDTVRRGNISELVDIFLVVETLDLPAGAYVVLEAADRGEDRAGALVLVDADVPQPGKISHLAGFLKETTSPTWRWSALWRLWRG